MRICLACKIAHAVVGNSRHISPGRCDCVDVLLLVGVIMACLFARVLGVAGFLLLLKKSVEKGLGSWDSRVVTHANGMANVEEGAARGTISP